MWRSGGFVLLLLVCSAWGQEFPEGTQDGPCPDIRFNKKLQWYRLAGSWTEVMRFNISGESHQCPQHHTYEGNPPNITNWLTLGLQPNDQPIPWQGRIIDDMNNRRVFPNIFGGEPAEFTFETIYTNYRNIHIFQQCINMEGNKHFERVWIETRDGRMPSKRKLNTQLRRLEKMGVDTSRFWDLEQKYCDEILNAA